MPVAANGLVGGTVVTCDDRDRVFADGLVAWEDERITYVGPRAAYTLTGKEDWLDVAGHYVMPGIVNLHTHTPMTALRGLADDLPAHAWLPRAAQLESHLTPEDRYWSSMCGAWELLRRGVTCIADRGSGMVTSSRALWDSGIRAAVAQTVTDRGGEADWQESDTVIAQWGVDSSRRVFAGLGPHATDTCGDALLLKVRERMEDLGALTFIHVAQSRDEVDAARRRGDAGCVYVLHRLGLLGARTIAAHCLYLQPGEIELLSATRTPVAHCPVSNAKVEGSAALAWELWQAGVPLGLGTDCAACNNSMDPWFEVKFAALLHKISAKNPEALPARTALDAASIGVLLNARSRGLPLKTFAAVLQRHPFAFFFLKRSGVRTPADFEGKTIGIQPTARPLLEAVLKKHHIAKDHVKVVSVGGDISPLVTHQVDVITGWVIDRVPQFENMGVADQVGYFKLWDLGIRMYAYTYFCTDQVYGQRKDVLARFVAATAKGWLYARDHPDEAIDIVLRSTTGLDRTLEVKTLRNMEPYFTSIATKQHGWGHMDPGVWADLSSAYVALEQMPREVKPEEIMTNEVVEMAKTPKV